MNAGTSQDSDRCPECKATLVSGSFYCHICGQQVCDAAGPSRASKRAVVTCRWLLVAGWLTCAVAWILVVAVDVESVVGTGPIIFSIGGAIIILGGIVQYRLAIWAGVAHCGICVLFTALVNIFSWSPREAEMPFGIMGAVYVIASLPLTWWAFRRPPPTRQPWECRECGYLLFGLAEPRCPECGTTFDPQVLRCFGADSDLAGRLQQ